MAVSFRLRTQKTAGKAPLFVRVQDVNLKVNLMLSTHLDVDIETWNKPHTGRAFKAYINSPDGRRAYELSEEIKHSIESLLSQNIRLTSAMTEKLIDDIVYREERIIAAQKQHYVTLNQYIDRFITSISSGARQTEKGTNYAASTVKSVRAAMTQFGNFQIETGRKVDFQDVDMNFYHEYTAYLKGKNYSINSIGKCIKELKTILRAAESEGYEVNPKYKDKKFKGTRIEVDSIYLNRGDLEKIMNLDISKCSQGYAIARDIFMVGVWTAQRVSDYNNLSRENIKQHRIPKVIDNKLTYKEFQTVEIRQKKTGAKVSIPVSSELKNILERYDYQLPHLEDQVLNRYMKDICKLAGLDELIQIQTTKGGKAVKEFKHKWELVHSHTARRTGATLMYLAGMDYYDIMRITGHTSPTMLKKYIKADSIEVADKITDKYNYFD
jgi:integrase